VLIYSASVNRDVKHIFRYHINESLGKDAFSYYRRLGTTPKSSVEK
jgi:hypothetical protein